MLHFDVLSLFPEMFTGFQQEGIFARAQAQGLLQLELHQIRDYSLDKHRRVDDLPYGGGAGMVMQCEPLFRAWQAVQEREPHTHYRTISFSPQGQPLQQAWLEQKVEEYRNGAFQGFILVCGRYEGIDQRFIEECVEEEISLGDFVLSGGEVAAMAFMDAMMRLLPGALGNEASLSSESFSRENEGLLEYPQYTRPAEFHGRGVPSVLLSGDHKKIEAWRREQSWLRTKERRADLLPGTQKKG